MSDEVRYSAVGRQYVPCDTFDQFLESDFGKFINGFLFTVGKDDVLTITGTNGEFKVNPYQFLFIYDEDRLFVKDAGEIQ